MWENRLLLGDCQGSRLWRVKSIWTRAKSARKTRIRSLVPDPEAYEVKPSYASGFNLRQLSYAIILLNWAAEVEEWALVSH